MSDLYAYISAFFSHWWPLVSAGSLFGVQEFLERYAQPLNDHAKYIIGNSGPTFTRIALVFSIFYSGYLAWSDEHQIATKAIEEKMRLEGEIDVSRKHPAMDSSHSRVSRFARTAVA